MALSKKAKETIKNIGLVLLGSFVLALGNALFLVPCDLITGGCSSIGIIVQHFFPDVNLVDIVTAVAQIVLFLVGLVFLGKRFALNTLISSLAYPAFFSVMYRLNIGHVVSDTLTSAGDGKNFLLFLYAVFGGLLIGAGVAFAFLGKGSTGGIDVLTHILFKFFRIRESIGSFILDSSVIIVGMFVFKDIPLGLIGIISAFIAALMIKYIYNYANSYYVANIISCKTDEISRFIQDDLGRGCTLLDAYGGYKGEDRRMIRVALTKVEATQLRSFISKIDPAAFVTFSTANAINGEGFSPLVRKKKKNVTSKKGLGQFSDGE